VAAEIQAGSDLMIIPTPDCFASGLELVVQRYYHLQAALAGDDDDAASLAAGHIGHALKAINCQEEEFAVAPRLAWQQMINELELAAQRIKNATNIGDRRLGFETLSDDLWLAVTTFQGRAPTDVKRFHCPMAMDGTGAYWLQSGTTTANPYYGSSMLRCGSQVASLASPDAGE